MAKFDANKALEALSSIGTQLTIMSQVLEERRRQINELEYPPDHDDQHDDQEFAWIIQEYVTKIATVDAEPEKIREWFVKIAAMGLAAIETMDRRNDSN